MITEFRLEPSAFDCGREGISKVITQTTTLLVGIRSVFVCVLLAGHVDGLAAAVCVINVSLKRHTSIDHKRGVEIMQVSVSHFRRSQALTMTLSSWMVLHGNS